MFQILKLRFIAAYLNVIYLVNKVCGHSKNKIKTDEKYLIL